MADQFSYVLPIYIYIYIYIYLGVTICGTYVHACICVYGE